MVVAALVMKAIILIRFSSVCVIPAFNDGKFHPVLSHIPEGNAERLLENGNPIKLYSSHHQRDVCTE